MFLLQEIHFGLSILTGDPDRRLSSHLNAEEVWGGLGSPQENKRSGRSPSREGPCRHRLPDVEKDADLAGSSGSGGPHGEASCVQNLRSWGARLGATPVVMSRPHAGTRDGGRGPWVGRRVHILWPPWPWLCAPGQSVQPQSGHGGHRIVPGRLLLPSLDRVLAGGGAAISSTTVPRPVGCHTCVPPQPGLRVALKCPLNSLQPPGRGRISPIYRGRNRGFRY